MLFYVLKGFYHSYRFIDVTSKRKIVDDFVTNNNIFKWTVAATSIVVGNDTVSQAGVEYKGQPLACQVYLMELNANVHSYTVGVTATVGCLTSDFWMSATTTYTTSSLALGDFARYLGAQSPPPAQTVGRL